MNLNIIGKPAYKLELPSNIARVYLMSYVSHLRKNLRVSDEEIHTEDMDLQDPLEYLEHFMKILDQAVKKLEGRPFLSAKSCEATTPKEKQNERQKDSEAAPHLFTNRAPP